MTSSSAKDTASSKTTQKFHKKRERILDAAAELINQSGIKGMTFVEVAKLVGLNTTSVTYYFKRKEQLAAAVLERSLTTLEGLIERAGQESDARSRVRQFIRIHCELRADIRLNKTSPLAVLTDLKALDDPHRSQLLSRYYQLFNGVEAFFPKAKNKQDQFLLSARAHILLNTMLWLPAWSVPYSISDFPRVQQRLFELFDMGLLAEDQQIWQPKLLTQNDSELDSRQDGIPDQFLRAATSLINELGYRGASVERISSELNVTKGSFYHHLPTKDDLVRECFRHSYHRITLIQRDASTIEGNYWHKLSSALATLLDIQLSSEFPLLKPTAWQPLPWELRSDIQLRTDRYAQRFSSLLIDGISDGSLRTVDPLLTAQVIIYMLNAAYDLRQQLNGLSPEQAVELYASVLTRGLFA